MKLVGCVGNAPTLVLAGHPLYRRLAIFTRLPTRRNGCGTWSRTTIRELMRLPRFSTFPRLKMVDRRGYAPRTAGCKPADFLTNLAAQKWHGGWVSRPHNPVLETGALLVCHRRIFGV